MDRDHRLAAPNNDALSGIEQISDRSELTSIYREPGEQFEGELLSAEARKKVKADELEAITSGLGKHALKIGIYIPLPFVTGLFIITGLFLSSGMNEILLVFLSFFALSAWLITSYRAYAAIYKTFYKHALRAGTYIVVMLASILMASQAIYWIITETFSSQSLLFSVSLISLLLVAYSLVANFILLGIWGNSRLGSGIKALVSGLILVVSGFFVVATYLF